MYDERYLESLGARPTRASVALVSKLTSISNDGIKLRLRKVGYRHDEVHITPDPPQICKLPLGGRRPALSRTMVRVAAANEIDFRCRIPDKSESAGAAEPEPKGGAFEAVISRFVFPYCLAVRLDDEVAQQAAVDLRMPARIKDLPENVPGLRYAS